MAPPAADVDLAIRPAEVPLKVRSKAESGTRLSQPLKYSGSLDQYKHFDITPVIGEEFPELQLSEILSDDNKIRDLAILGKSPIRPLRMQPDHTNILSLATWCSLLP
jgi:hypothetical protein